MDCFQKFDAFFFDFDGLLVDTEQLHMNAYQMTLQNHGIDLNWDFTTYCKYAHESTKVLSEAVYAHAPKLREIEPNWEKVREQKIAIYNKLIQDNQVHLMPGVKEIIEWIKGAGKKMCVVTNSTISQVDPIRHHLTLLNEIPLWITRESYNKPKPNPDGYLTAIHHLQCQQDTMIGFEDTSKGIEALLQTPIQPICINAFIHEGLDKVKNHNIPIYSSFLDFTNAALCQVY
jgi:HAD superfamily hydrolase (TIGR01509 family)